MSEKEPVLLTPAMAIGLHFMVVGKAPASAEALDAISSGAVICKSAAAERELQTELSKYKQLAEERLAKLQKVEGAMLVLEKYVQGLQRV